MEFFGKSHTKAFQYQRNLLRNVIRKTQYYSTNELFYQFITELKKSSLLVLNTFFLRTVCLNIILDLDLLMNIRDNLDLIILFMKIFILYEIILISKEFPNSLTSQFLVNDFVGKK